MEQEERHHRTPKDVKLEQTECFLKGRKELMALFFTEFQDFSRIFSCKIFQCNSYIRLKEKHVWAELCWLDYPAELMKNRAKILDNIMTDYMQTFSSQIQYFPLGQLALFSRSIAVNLNNLAVMSSESTWARVVRLGLSDQLICWTGGRRENAANIYRMLHKHFYLRQYPLMNVYICISTFASWIWIQKVEHYRHSRAESGCVKL